MGDVVPAAMKVHHFLGPQSPQDFDLLDAAAAPVVEILTQGLELHFVPANAHSHTQPATA